jgi:RNA recognition motif-containing protein
MNIYVGNLPYKTDNDSLRAVFEQYGQVDSVDIIVDRRSGRSRGYGFVTMGDDAEGSRAVEALNGSELDGRNLRVDVSKPKGGDNENRPRRSNNRPVQNNVPNGAAEQKSGGVIGFIKKLFS